MQINIAVKSLLIMVIGSSRQITENQWIEEGFIAIHWFKRHTNMLHRVEKGGVVSLRRSIRESDAILHLIEKLT